MAEFLVYNKENWMDALTQKQIDEHLVDDDDFMTKYNARDQKGDIIEVREDGYWTDGKRKGFGSPAFSLVTIPGMSYSEAQYLLEMYFEDPDADEQKILKNRKHQMDTVQISFDAKNKAEL